MHQKNQFNHSSDNGTVVFNARTMYNLLNPAQFTMYANNCLSTSNKMQEPENVVQEKKDAYIVYPNPTSGGFYIKSKTYMNTDIEVEVFDVRGKMLLKQNCTLATVDCFISFKAVDGLYLVKIKNITTNETYISKLEMLH
jgi:hypothetical protein